MSRGHYFYKNGPLKEANEELEALWRRIDALEAKKSVSVLATVGTVETEVRHSLGKIPKDVIPVPRSQATVWQTRTPTETSVFLAASIAVKCDVRIA